jgi:hypothetical protein
LTVTLPTNGIAGPDAVEIAANSGVQIMKQRTALGERFDKPNSKVTVIKLDDMNTS